MPNTLPLPATIAARATVVAIALCAFAVTDIAHESLGHGGAYVLLGGRSFVLTTTKLLTNGPGVDPHRVFAGHPHGDLFGVIFAAAGPLASFLLAAVFLFPLMRRVCTGMRCRLFLWLSAAFSLCWACGYMVSSGAIGEGDYFELVRKFGHDAVARSLLIALGIVLYGAAMRLLGNSLLDVFTDRRAIPRALLWTAYFTAACLATLAAFLDPRGPGRIFTDAFPATLIANFALPFLARQTGGAGAPSLRSAWPDASAKWMVAACGVALFYIFRLGPGISLKL